jgi:hypothetical protein
VDESSNTSDTLPRPSLVTTLKSYGVAETSPVAVSRAPAPYPLAPIPSEITCPRVLGPEGESEKTT